MSDTPGTPGSQKPPSLETLLSAVLLLLQKIATQTDQIETLLEELTAQGDQSLDLQQQANQTLTSILSAISGEQPPADKVLTTIKLIFKGVEPMPPIIPGPVVLTQAGQQVVAEVIGYDQFGNLWSGSMPDWTLSNDNEDAATLDEGTGIVTAVANGVANITADVTTAEGVALTDTESVTVNIAVEEPVLTTIKVVFTNPGVTKKGKK